MSSESSNSNEEPLSFEFTKTLNHIIERVWYVLRDASVSSALFPNDCCPLIVKPGNNTWTVNNEFYGQISSFGDFVGKCLKVKNFPQMKKIRWEIHPKDKKLFIFHFQYQLFKITEKNSTVLLWKINFLNKEGYTECKKEEGKLNKMWEEYTKNINYILNSSPMNLFQFEAGVITTSMKSIWEFITNISKIKKIAPLVPFDCEDHFSLAAPPGSVTKVTSENGQKFFYIKTVKSDKRPNWNKWVVVFLMYGGEPKIPLQTVVITITKINYEECHFASFHEFKEPASLEYLKGLSDMKKYVIASIKDYLENYSMS